MNKSGIYCITNNTNGKVYIGQAKDFETRRWEHFRKLEKEIHFNKHLQSAWSLNPDENLWSFEIIEYCEISKDILDSRETFWIKEYDSINPEIGYNKCTYGNSRLGTTHTEEAKNKMSEIHKGKPHSEEHRRKNSEANKGVSKTEEHCIALSLAHKKIQDQKAFIACGDSNKRKCKFCHNYDGTENMIKHGRAFCHRDCYNKYRRERYYAKEKE